MFRSLTFIFIVLLSVSACTNPEAEKAQQKEVSDSLLHLQKDSLLNAFKAELTEISKQIDQVNVRNGLMNSDSTEGEVLSKESILEKVSSLDGMLNRNQSELQSLRNKMRDSQVKSKELEAMIQGMQERISARESQIDELMKMLENKDVQIEQIKERLDTMRRENINLTEDIIEMDEQMHLVYYVIGEHDELREKGIVTKEGGILGIGGSKKLDVSQLDQAKFTTVDQRELESIPLYSKKAKLITNHPEASYELSEDSEGKVEYLKVLDRKAFWSATNYLVVEVSN